MTKKGDDKREECQDPAVKEKSATKVSLKSTNQTCARKTTPGAETAS